MANQPDYLYHYTSLETLLNLIKREFDISSMQLPCSYQLSLCSFLASLATDCMQ